MREMFDSNSKIDQARLRYSFFSLLTSPEVSRLLEDITTCRLEVLDRGDLLLEGNELPGGLELFPYFTLQHRWRNFQIRGILYPNREDETSGILRHLVKLDLGDKSHFLQLSTPQASYLVSPFHTRFISTIFSLVLHYSLAVEVGASRDDFLFFAPYSLEEQVVARYLQSLVWIPCATVKLDSQDNPYIGSRLYTGADLKRCQPPGSSQEESLIRGWRLFKRLLYLSIEGERIFTGFAFFPEEKPLEYHRSRWPHLLLYHEADQILLEEGAEAIKQMLLNADGRNTFLAIYRDRIIGVIHLQEGAQRQLTTVRAWREVLPLATITRRGRFNFWIALKGRHNPRIMLSFLEYRHGHIHIPLFQEIFWQELERQLRLSCPDCDFIEALSRFKELFRALRLSGRGGIFLVGLTAARLQEPFIPIENEVRLAQPPPFRKPWLPILIGLAKSDGAVIFNENLEVTHFRARLKATGLVLPPLERDELGSGTRHQATRELSAFCPDILGIAISQDGPVSLYRQGKLVARLY